MAEIVLPGTGRPYATITAHGKSRVRDLDTGDVMDLYRAHGALLFRGFDVGLDEFREFTQRFCASSVFNESPDRKLLDDAHNIQSVNGGVASFPLHPELSREPWKPDTCFFCCLNPPREQGQTTVCDGVDIVRHMPDALRANLRGQRLLYIQPAVPEVLDYWLGTSNPDDRQLANPPAHCPYKFRRISGQIIRLFSRPALHQPMFTDALAFGNFLLFARYFIGLRGFPLLLDGREVPDVWLDEIKAIGDRLSAPVAWQRGDLLMLDNTRFMHGRTAIVDSDERLIASYFGYLHDAPVNPEEPIDPPWRKAAFRPPQRRETAAPAASA